jgi:hypothetical protein
MLAVCGTGKAYTSQTMRDASDFYRLYLAGLLFVEQVIGGPPYDLKSDVMIFSRKGKRLRLWLTDKISITELSINADSEDLPADEGCLYVLPLRACFLHCKFSICVPNWKKSSSKVQSFDVLEHKEKDGALKFLELVYRKPSKEECVIALSMRKLADAYFGQKPNELPASNLFSTGWLKRFFGFCSALDSNRCVSVFPAQTTVVFSMLSEKDIEVRSVLARVVPP